MTNLQTPEAIKSEPVWFAKMPFTNEWDFVDKNMGVMYTGYDGRPNMHIDTYKALNPSSQYSDLMTYDEVKALTESWENSNIIQKSMKQIDSDRYSEALNILPPCRWNKTSGVEHFFISEAYTSNIHTWFLNDGDFFMCMDDRSNADINKLLTRFGEFRDQCSQIETI